MSPVAARFLRDGFAFWSVLALVLLAKGTLGMSLLESLVGESAARPVTSLVFLSLAYGLVLLFLGHAGRPDSASPAWALGAIWALMTLAFELIVFVGILRLPSAGVTEAFTLSNVLEGNLFALELVMLFVAPAALSLVSRQGFAAGRAIGREQAPRPGLRAEMSEV